MPFAASHGDRYIIDRFQRTESDDDIFQNQRGRVRHRTLFPS
jgi:hypothetical protein